jgi:myo-inositol-1(or 4)-monophosphatase
MVEGVIDIVVAAGRLVETIRTAGFAVRQKGDHGPVTEADQAADRMLRRELLGLEACGWLSEETADDRSRLELRRVWVVDPLDGTKEFVRGVPEYSVAVALVDSGRPVLGVVHNPATGELFWAERGKGAFRNGDPIRVTESEVLLASHAELSRGEFEPFESRWTLQPKGSIEYKLALVAGGEAAVTLSQGPKWEWDVCAGALIVEEAGGIATDATGEGFRFNRALPKVRGVVAGSPGAHRRCLSTIESIGPIDRMGELEG